jgi:hypothetical protein
MPITNYGELRAAVALRAVRTDLDALIPDFVRAAHEVLSGKLVLCAELSVAAERVALPADFRTVVSLWVDAYPAASLTLAAEPQMRGLGGGTPVYFRVDGSELVFGPLPDGAYAGRLLYKLRREMFTDDAASNAALIRYPSLYLHGAMAELFAHVRQAEERDRYLSLFLSGIEAANAAELEDATGAATLRPQGAAVI